MAKDKDRPATDGTKSWACVAKSNQTTTNKSNDRPNTSQTSNSVSKSSNPSRFNSDKSPYPLEKINDNSDMAYAVASNIGENGTIITDHYDKVDGTVSAISQTGSIMMESATLTHKTGKQFHQKKIVVETSNVVAMEIQKNSKRLLNSQKQFEAWSSDVTIKGADDGFDLNSKDFSFDPEDMIRLNKEKFGIESSYNEDDYTMPIKKCEKYEQRRREADRIAAGMEKNLREKEKENVKDDAEFSDVVRTRQTRERKEEEMKKNWRNRDAVTTEPQNTGQQVQRNRFEDRPPRRQQDYQQQQQYHQPLKQSDSSTSNRSDTMRRKDNSSNYQQQPSTKMEARVAHHRNVPQVATQDIPKPNNEVELQRIKNSIGETQAPKSEKSQSQGSRSDSQASSRQANRQNSQPKMSFQNDRHEKRDSPSYSRDNSSNRDRRGSGKSATYQNQGQHTQQYHGRKSPQTRHQNYQHQKSNEHSHQQQAPYRSFNRKNNRRQYQPSDRGGYGYRDEKRNEDKVDVVPATTNTSYVGAPKSANVSRSESSASNKEGYDGSRESSITNKPVNENIDIDAGGDAKTKEKETKWNINAEEFVPLSVRMEKEFHPETHHVNALSSTNPSRSSTPPSQRAHSRGASVSSGGGRGENGRGDHNSHNRRINNRQPQYPSSTMVGISPQITTQYSQATSQGGGSGDYAIAQMQAIPHSVIYQQSMPPTQQYPQQFYIQQNQAFNPMPMGVMSMGEPNATHQITTRAMYQSFPHHQIRTIVSPEQFLHLNSQPHPQLGTMQVQFPTDNVVSAGYTINQQSVASFPYTVPAIHPNQVQQGGYNPLTNSVASRQGAPLMTVQPTSQQYAQQPRMSHQVQNQTRPPPAHSTPQMQPNMQRPGMNQTPVPGQFQYSSAPQMPRAYATMGPRSS